MHSLSQAFNNYFMIFDK